MASRSWKTKYNCLLKVTIGPCFLICGPLFHQQVLVSEEERGSIWKGGSNMLYPRTKIAAEQINGKIYVIGWTDNNGTITNTVQIYDADKDALTSGAPLPIDLDQAGITFFGGKLYVVGDFVPTPQGGILLVLCSCKTPH